MFGFKEQDTTDVNKKFELLYSGLELGVYLTLQPLIDAHYLLDDVPHLKHVSGLDLECEMNALLLDDLNKSMGPNAKDVFGGVQEQRTRWDLALALRTVNERVRQVIWNKVMEKKLGLSEQSVREQLEGEARRIETMRKLGMPAFNSVGEHQLKQHRHHFGRKREIVDGECRIPCLHEGCGHYEVGDLSPAG